MLCVFIRVFIGIQKLDVSMTTGIIMDNNFFIRRTRACASSWCECLDRGKWFCCQEMERLGLLMICSDRADYRVIFWMENLCSLRRMSAHLLASPMYDCPQLHCNWYSHPLGLKVIWLVGLSSLCHHTARVNSYCVYISTWGLSKALTVLSVNST